MPLSCRIFLSLFIIILIGFIWKKAIAQQNEYTSPAGTKYLLYLPPDYSPPNNSPLLVYLHGGASIGDDITALYRNHITPPRLINDGNWPASRPLLVLSPLLPRDESIPNPNDQQWPMDLLNEVVMDVINNNSIDVDRIYFTGISLGGAACWDYALTYSSQVAAIIPFSGVSDTTEACNFIDIPIWAFHGSVDGLVPTQLSIDMINAINSCSPSGQYIPNLTLLYSKKHEGWNEVYDGSSGYRIYDWMLMFSKTDMSNKKPFVNAGFDKNIFLRENEFNVFYEYFDWDNEISSINWTQLSGTALTMSFDQQGSFLKLEDLITGTFSFKLEATDDLGLSNSDTITINILEPSTSGIPVINEIILHDGETAIPIGTITEDQIINLEILGTDRINLEAVVNEATVSVRFHINGNHYTLRTGNSGPYFLRDPSKSNHWEIRNGEFYFCATAYEENGTRGDPGITQCHKVTVYNQPIKTFYPKPGSDITLLSSWGVNPDGSGNAPDSFTDLFQEFKITENTSIDASWDISGVGSYTRVASGINLSINDIFTGMIYTEDLAEIEINQNSQITFDSLSLSSIIKISADNFDIPKANYGNLQLLGSNTINELISGNTTIRGDLLIDNTVTLNGNSGNISTVSLHGDLTDNGNTPTIRYNLIMESGLNQSILTNKPILEYQELTLTENTTVDLSSSNINNTVLEVGSVDGGGLLLGNNSYLNMGLNSLSIINSGTINPDNTTGEIGITNGDVVTNSDSDLNSYLNLNSSNRDINTIDINLTGTGQFFFNTPVSIWEKLLFNNGIINSLGNLYFQSGPTNTAYIGKISGNGQILGNINMERYIENAGRIWKYMASPLSGSTVSEWQQYIPITGSFPESSPGFPTNPSLYEYDEPQGGWIPFPVISASEEFIPGKGYAIFLRDDQVASPLNITGEVHIGDFQYNLIPDPDTGEPDNGWNLIGNPYPSPILWSNQGWTRNGVNNTIYIRDNTVSEGRFLVWDGVDGDPEFSGQIAVGQSFWVRTTSTTPSLSSNEEVKIESTDISFFRIDNSHPEIQKLIITLSNGDLIDRTFLKFSDQYTDRFDTDYDAIKRKNGYFNVYTMSTDSVELAINYSGNSCYKSIPVLIDGIENGEYWLQIQPDGISQSTNIFLIDQSLKDTINLTEKNFYNFTISGEDPDITLNRFLLLISNSIQDELKLSVPDHICSDRDSLSLIIDSLSPDFSYEVFTEDSTLLFIDSSDTGQIHLSFPTELFQTGSNNIYVRSINRFCQYISIDSIHFQMLHSPRPENFSIEYCEDEKLTISPDINTDSYLINWYLEKNDKYSLIKRSKQIITNNPEFNNLYYKIVNKNGCISQTFGNIKLITISIPDPIIALYEDVLVSNYISGNQWYRNNKIINHATTNQYKPHDPGIYEVVVDSLGCQKRSNRIIYRKHREFRAPSYIKVFPNPVVNNIIRIRFNHYNDYDKLQYYILDTRGRVRDAGNLKFNKNIEILLKDEISSGLYILKIDTGNRIFFSKFIVR